MIEEIHCRNWFSGSCYRSLIEYNYIFSKSHNIFSCAFVILELLQQTQIFSCERFQSKLTVHWSKLAFYKNNTTKLSLLLKSIDDCYFQISIEGAKLRKHLRFHVKRKTLIHFYLRHNYELTMDIDVNQIAVGHVERTFII